MTTSRWLTPALVLVGLVALAQWTVAHTLWVRLSDAGPAVILLTALGLLGSHVLRALRLHAEWHPRRGVGRIECLRVALLHSAAVNLMPMRSGELGFPWLLWRRWQVPVIASARSLLWMRLQDALVLLWMGAMTACARVAGDGPAALAWSALAAVMATAGLVALSVRPPARPMYGPTPEAMPATRAARLHVMFDEARRALAGASPATWTWCIANWGLKVATLATLMAVLSGDRAWVGWCAALGGELAAAVPVQAPAGFGTYEAASALGARLAGAPEFETMLAAALVAHLAALVFTLSGAAVAGLAGHPRVAPWPGAVEIR